MRKSMINQQPHYYNLQDNKYLGNAGFFSDFQYNAKKRKICNKVRIDRSKRKYTANLSYD